MNKSEYLFNKLKREGECWEDYMVSLNFFEPHSKTDEWYNFGWLWERIQEHKRYEFFLMYHGEIELRNSLFVEFISCTDLAEALYGWFKGQKGQVVDVQA